MGMDREFLILVAAGLLSLLVIGIAGVEHFVVGAVLVATVVAVALVLALARFGPDRVPLETYLVRRMRYARGPKRYSYLRPAPRPRVAVTSEPPAPAAPRARPVTWQADDPGAAYGLATALAMIAGAYFLLWLGRGGADELAMLWRVLLPEQP